ncbi:MAG: hypothetical protein ACR2LL_12530 [Nitrosopumilus sp.]
MKKIKTYLSLFVIVLPMLGVTFSVMIPNVYSLDYNDQVLIQQDHLWHLGKNLSTGDSYTYKICDPKTIQTTAANYHYFTQGNDDHNSSTCYTIKLDFVNLLNSDENQIYERDVWVVQATIDEKNDGLRYSVFHIDTLTFEVTSSDTIHPDIKKYADSLQKTLFSIHKYTAPESQLLQIGQSWGEVTEALKSRGENPFMTVLNDSQEFSVIQNEIVRLIDKRIFPKTIEISGAFEVGYEIDIQDPVIFDQKKKKLVPVNEEKDNNNVTTSFLISSQLPFPLSGESYTPVYLAEPQKEFEFELLVFQTKNKNIDFENSVIDESKDDDVYLPITETGTIRLTFPQDDDIVSEEDEIETASEDDKVIDDIPEEEDKEIITDNDIEVIPEDDDVEITSNDVTVVNNEKVDYSKIAGLVVLLSIMIAGFVIFKKFRESGLKNTLLKQKPPQQHQSAKKKKILIPFDDKLHIGISRT